MAFIQNFPFFCIIISMFSAIISFVLSGNWAKRVHLLMVTVVLILSIGILGFTLETGESYTFMMGHFPAPWGNEIRIGVLEALMAVFFSLIMLLSVLGGIRHIDREVMASKTNLFYILLDLLLSSLLALIYTNDLFTAYVFIEINTIAACGIIMIKKKGRSFVSALRYMVMSLCGSGFFLLGLSMLYGVTGQLLMSPAKDAWAKLVESGLYEIPLLVVIILITIGLCIKSGLYPFHSWIPDAYSYATPTGSAVLSSLVSKGYIFLLVKIMYRVIGMDNIIGCRVLNVLFVFGIIAMMAGSILAIREDNIQRMTAFSSVAQIGYIYMGIGLGTEAGFIAAMFHIISHALMKSLLFISGAGLVEVSGGGKDQMALLGCGFRNKVAGIAFTIGSLSMIGVPLFTGFISKYLFASAAFGGSAKMMAAIIALAISTLLNVVYFGRMLLIIYSPVTKELHKPEGLYPSMIENIGTLGLAVMNVVLGVASYPIIQAIALGLSTFD